MIRVNIKVTSEQGATFGKRYDVRPPSWLFVFEDQKKGPKNWGFFAKICLRLLI